MKCYLFDLDGTLADCEHRRHHVTGEKKDWDAFYAGCGEDPPVAAIAQLCRDLAEIENIVYVTGRPERCREATEEWLSQHVLPAGPIYMRKDDDYRADDVVKLELLAQIRADGCEPVLAFDDRDRVVKAWRKAGIPCAQVAEGDF